MGKISQYGQDTSISTSDNLLGNKASGPATQQFPIASLITTFWTLANIPTGGTNPVTRDNEANFDYIASGCVWSGDSYGSTKNASCTAGVVYLSGQRLTVAAVSARTFTASKDTYCDLQNNGDGTAVWVYTETTNNAVSPALTSGYLRGAIIITGASSIANVGSVNQGQEYKVLPIASSIAYSVTDSLGNLICPRDPNRKILSIRQRTTQFSTASTSATAVTGLSCPIIAPTGRKIKVTLQATYQYNNTNGDNSLASVWEGTVNSGTLIASNSSSNSNSAGAGSCNLIKTYTPSGTSVTINAGLRAAPAGTAVLDIESPTSMSLTVELA